MKHAEDHFSPIAPQYAAGRITYPEELYQFLADLCHDHDLAWDCATGSGQAAMDLARTYARVIATDISQELLALAQPDPRISYRTAPAEASGVESTSVDLVTVAQALHWFDLPRFWPEVNRVLKPHGVLAFWGYNWPVLQPDVDRVLEDFKAEIASSWPERSAILHREYDRIHPPFPVVPCPSFVASARWTLDNYLAHLRTWSGTRYYQEHSGQDVVERFRPAFASAWPDGCLPVSWPLALRVCRKT